MQERELVAKTMKENQLKMTEPILVFLDVETTGLSAANNDKICEIAILRCQNSKKVIQWQSLVNPCRQISFAASSVNGISDKMVADAPVFSVLADKILELIKDAIIICHNAAFDLSFLSAEFENCGLCLPNNKVIDTLKIARQYFDFPSNSLGNIAEYLEIDVKEKHRAMADVFTMYEVFNCFIKELSNQGINQLDQLLTSHIWFPRTSVKNF